MERIADFHKNLMRKLLYFTNKYGILYELTNKHSEAWLCREFRQLCPENAAEYYATK